MFELFFPVAIAAVLLITIVTLVLVLQERASAKRQKVWADGYFASQDARYARREQAERQAVLSAVDQRR